MFSERTDWPLSPNRLSQLLEQRRQSGLPLIDLTESNPTRCGFHYDLEEILGALSDPRALAYEPDPRGLLSARLAVRDYYAGRGVHCDPMQIFLTTSTSEAYSYVFRLLANAGDNILAPRPSYPLLDFLSRLSDLELVPYSLAYDCGWRISLESIQARVGSRTRAIVVIHPNNPTGSFVHEEEFVSLVESCKARGLALISDEVFADYAFGSDLPRIMSCSTREVLSFALSGLSKISALPQMKLAWLVVNGPPRNLSRAVARLEVIADTYLSVSVPLAQALPRLLEARHAMQPQIRERVRSNVLWLDAKLSSDSLVTRLETEGGWYAILKLPSTRTDEEWAIELLREDGVLVHPGHFYDFAAEGHLVISLLPEASVFQQGISMLLDRVTQLA